MIDDEQDEHEHAQPPSPTGSTYSRRSTVPESHANQRKRAKLHAGRESRARYCLVLVCVVLSARASVSSPAVLQAGHLALHRQRWLQEHVPL